MKACHHLLQWFPVNTSRGFGGLIVQGFLPGCFLLCSWIEQKQLEIAYFMSVSFLHSLGCWKRLVVTQSSYALYWGFFPLWILHVIKHCWHRYVFFLVWVRSGLRGYKKKKKWRFFHISVPHGISLVNTYLGIWKLLIKHVHRISVHCEPFCVKGFPVCLHIRCLRSVSSVVP